MRTNSDWKRMNNHGIDITENNQFAKTIRPFISTCGMISIRSISDFILIT